MKRPLLALLVALLASSSSADVLQYKSVLRAETTVTPRWTHDGANLSVEQINALVAEANGIELLTPQSFNVLLGIHMKFPSFFVSLKEPAPFIAAVQSRINS